MGNLQLPDELPLANFTIQHFQDGITWMSREGAFLKVNPAFCEMTGYPEKELLKKNIFEVDPTINLFMYHQLWDSALEEKNLVFESKHMHRTGTIYPVEIQAQVILVEGKPYCCCVVRDIMVVQRDANLLKALSEETQYGTWEWNLIEQQLIFTDQVYSIFDSPPMDRVIKGKTFLDFLHPFALPKPFAKLKNIINEAIDQKKSFRHTLRMRNLSGAKIWVEITGQPFLVENQLLQIRGTITDVTRTKKRSEMLHLSKVTLDNALEMIIWIDDKGNIVYSNNAIKSNLGYTQKELKKIKAWEINSDLDQNNWPDFWAKLAAEKQLSLEGLHQRRDGTAYPVAGTLTYIQHEKRSYISAIYRNTTKTRNQKQALQSALSKVNAIRDRVEKENVYLKQEISSDKGIDNIISKSPKYRTILQQIHQVAPTDSTVLITGETGTGKELLARAVHQLSNRSQAALVKINCAALPPNLVESELFGHEKGAFTGAYERKIGRFEMADNATLFLDEIGELSLGTQAKLLRVLQEGEFSRVGSIEVLVVNVRVIAATNRNLEKLVASKKFREDLYYRLNVFPIENLPLRNRKSDIPLLVTHFMKKYAIKSGKRVDQIEPSALEDLMKYNFPGNIRELENIVERAIILSSSRTLNMENVIPKNKVIKASKGVQPFDYMVKTHLIKALRQCKWKVSGPNGAAQLLNLNAKTLESKMRKYDIKKSDFML